MKKFFVLIGLLVLLFGCTANNNKNNTIQIPENSTQVTNQTLPVADCYGPVCGNDNRQYATNCDAISAGVGIAINGTCLEPTYNCTDSDNGLNILEAGNTSKGTNIQYDRCLNDGTVLEYTCINNEIANATMQCGSGMVCINGYCRTSAQNNSNNTQYQSGCYGPNAPHINVSNQTVFNGIAYQDTCADFRTVKDFYCQDGILRNQNEICPNGYGCTNGSCVVMQSYCTDTDGGIEPLVKGKVRVSSVFFRSGDIEDVCINESTITEQYCLQNGSASMVDVECGNGRKCQDGRCTRSACTDSDGGRDYFQKGTTTSNDIQNTDFCISDKTLNEYTCNGDQSTHEEYRCENGDTCVDGACVHNN